MHCSGTMMLVNCQNFIVKELGIKKVWRVKFEFIVKGQALVYIVIVLFNNKILLNNARLINSNCSNSYVRSNRLS